MRDDIKHIMKALQCACQNNESVTTLLGSLETAIEEGFNTSNFLSIPGNSQQVTYYVDAGGGANPSGSTDNIETIVYLTGATPIFTKTFIYDINNNIIEIVVS